MAREFARRFYKSKQWESTRNAYFDMRRGLCERCMREGRITPGAIVHHKIHLEPNNINDPSISLSFDNLELVCRDCHAKEHPEIYQRKDDGERRVGFDEEGNIVNLEGTPEWHLSEL